MINQKETQELVERIIICENIRDMYREEGKRKNLNYYNGKVEGLYLAMEIVGYQRSTAVGMTLMEREKKIKRKIEQKNKPAEEETQDDQQGKI